ncbi:hypothetical protein ABWK22_02785 [Gottfriedia acidiceleris]|uniref:hypothetical protein n=1 Tax=Gottfriedia acidiceleris TaxID=371036 RepID=UPI003396F54C
MTVMQYAPQQFMPQQQMYGMQQQPQKQTDPFWYRQNTPHLIGVTSGPSNPQFGIENISLKPASANQLPHGILFNGLLRSVIGSISFQVRVSSRTQAPFVQTISTESGVDQQGQKTYWEHINLTPQVKAQVLRFAEALMTGQAPAQPMQQQMYGMPQQQFGMPMQQMQQPMNQGMYMQPQQFAMQQQPMVQQPVINYGQQQQAYTPPPAQNMETQQPPAEQQTPADDVQPQLQEEELPI